MTTRSSAKYRLDGDAGLIVREVAEMQGDQDPADVVISWTEPHDADVGEVEFRALPGIFQEAFVKYRTGRDVPPDPTVLMWAPSYGQDDDDAAIYMIRSFPPSEPGALDYRAVRRDLITAWFDQRGW